MKPYVMPSDQELQRQLQKLIKQQQAEKAVQKKQQDLEAQLQKLEKQLEAQEAVRAKKRNAAPKKPTPATMVQSVSKVISGLYKNYPKDLDAALNTFGYEKQVPTKPAAKKTTLQQMMDKDFYEIKQTTRLLLRSPGTPRTSLVKTRNILEKVLEKAPMRYRADLTKLLVAVEVRLVKK
jgi:hypothetical protein